MQPFNFFLHSFLLVLALFLSAKADEISNTIVVDQSGHGDFENIQNAVDSVPSNNQVWTLVHVKAGSYNEKVNIPRDKPKIVLKGESSGSTVIEFADGGDSIKSYTFSSHADDFVAMDITFRASAALINADKASFYRCRFIGVQDTLTDSQGRHYFERCYIEGAVDFIWGNGISIYQHMINVTAVPARRNLAGYITAQARDSAADQSGFVFKDGSIIGAAPVYLGRAYRPYARVVFHRTKMSDIIIPTGWSAWRHVGKENTIVFAEVDCEGAGADKSKRVPWEKSLSAEDLNQLLNINTFINQDGWIQKQPKGP